MTTAENDPRTSMQRLADIHKDASEIVGRTAETFDPHAADLVLRNLAVMTDRLSPAQFSALSETTREQVGVVAFIANDVAPQAEEDKIPHPDESEEDNKYRTTIWGPIHSLQTKIHTKNYNPNDEFVISKLRFAIKASGLAFASVLEESTTIPTIVETERYFWGNTEAAARAARRLIENETA